MAQDLLQIPQLVNLSHGLRAQEDVPIPRLVTPAAKGLEKGLGGGQSLLPGALLQGAPVWTTTRSAPIHWAT